MKRAAAPFDFLALLALLGGCAAPPDAAHTAASASVPTQVAAGAARQPQAQQALQVAATTSIIADIVREVGGKHVLVAALMPAEADPHGFSPTPASVRALAGSAALFTNGAGLEGWLSQLGGAAEQVPTYTLTDGLELFAAHEGSHEGDHEEAHGESGHEEHKHEDHEHGEYDPHAWWDPGHAASYAESIASALAALDPAHAADYRAGAEDFAARVREADDHGRGRFAGLPVEVRRVATEHDSLGYFARHYGLEVVGSVRPSLSTEAEPSAQELAALSREMKAEGVRVLLTGERLPSRLLDAAAHETGAVVVPVYSDALGTPGTAGDTYLGALRHNIDAVADALEAAQP